MPITVGNDSAKTRKTLSAGGQSVSYYSIKAAEESGLGDFSKLPVSLKVVLERLPFVQSGTAGADAAVCGGGGGADEAEFLAVLRAAVDGQTAN